MATTEAALLARITSVCVSAGYTQAVEQTLAQQPLNAIDGAFVLNLFRDTSQGGMNFTEEARVVASVELARLKNDDIPAAQSTLSTDFRTLLSAIVRDGALTSGEYAVEDAGLTAEVLAPEGASYLVLRARIPCNYEATL